MNQATPAQYDVILPAMRLGFARAASEAGLTPSQAEAKLAAMNKAADGIPVVGGLTGSSGLLGALSHAVETSFMAAAGIGALGGGLSGILRHNVERRLDNKDDPGIQTDEQKAKEYEKMTADLKRQQAATSDAPAFTAPRVQEAMR